ncbi:MAG: DNA polymerase elongation subunit (family B) [Thermoplasmata archaeon]|nr:DNA polymerase elongation subunit (family B) [Thermoplasmata archaeon]
MGETLLGVSPEYLYIHNKKPQMLEDIHKPHFLVFPPSNKNVEKEREKLIESWKKGEENPLKHITDIGEVEEYRSFWDFEKKRKAFRVYAKRSFLVPEISDYIFFNHDLYTAEHDIPYHQRVLVDLAATDKAWVLDTEGKRKKLRILVYDIETTEFEEGRTDLPIDIIGYTSLDLSIESEKDLEKEEFNFEVLDWPSNWIENEITQVVARNRDEEIDNLLMFCDLVKQHHIISGHNIAGFDNIQIHGRIEKIISENGGNLSKEQLKTFQQFLARYAKKDKSFHFGVGSEIVTVHPSTFDTYLGVRKFYPYLDDFGLKSVAPFLGIKIEGRVRLMPSQIKMDERTLLYNKHDVQEQCGVTLHLLEQALPLAFTTCMPFEMLLSSGAVNMWDHMAMIRAVHQKKIMPPVARVLPLSKSIIGLFPEWSTKRELVKEGKKKRAQVSKDLLRVLKYGEEMPDWVEYPSVIYNKSAKDKDEMLNYHMPGGMTIKPDKEANSHFVPWYHVIVADVGAMYPTILKALNIGADTVKLTRKNKEPDAWVWLKSLPKEFLRNYDVVWRDIGENERFADKGIMIGVSIDKNPGVVNSAMTGIMNVIAKIKKELRNEEDSEKKKRLKMIYQSLKGARNAGTHGILSAPYVSGRQFNLWGAAAITTKGQEILSDTLHRLNQKGIRIVYGDTDGIYLGCSKSMGNVPRLAAALGVKEEPDEKAWITHPDKALEAIRECTDLWRKQLNYSGFELEPEKHDAMIFVKHKNYLIFDAKNNDVEVIAKGNNFKGSDKANIARKALEEIMKEVLRENHRWDDEKQVRKQVKDSIKKGTREMLKKLDLTNVDLEDLTLVQSVQPAKRYHKNRDGSMSTYGRRAQALEELIGQKIRSRVKFKFVVTKKPLPTISNPSKSGVKPIDYMYPIELIGDLKDIDLDWYKTMIENYIKGAFGLTDVMATEQKGLDAWM